ncbi:ribonuclease H-like domain-containing protein [Tanacetum coccineum]|uniref:Ribonuclease H-like domain-containing protein n=1 Tax=Tanacetum coccineum TaxID=301880 RepID=A0ABQ5C6J2_9ASTR
MWLFRRKYHADGSLSRYKARLVANGHSQQQRIDCNKTFSLVVKPATICTILSIDVSRSRPIHQLELKNAFLHGHLSETVYMHQPLGFVDHQRPDYVCHLQRSLYGLKQAPMLGFSALLLMLYVDDIILTSSSSAFLQRVIASLYGEFAMTDLGLLNYFIGISAKLSSEGLFLSQSTYAEEILERAHMQKCNPCKTLVDIESKLGADGHPVSNPTLYRSLAGALQYLTFTRPDISYAVQQVCLYMHDPREPHLAALKGILRYVRDTIDHGVLSTSQLTSYIDADWAGCPVTRRSTSAKYKGVANVVAETAWVRNLLRELHAPMFITTLVYYDNVSAVYLSTNLVQHQRTKHIEIDIHFVRDFVAYGQVHVLHGHPQKEDQGYVDSGCSRHMTGNMSYLSDFKEFDGGYVTFGGGAKGGKITGKGTLKTGKLDFEDVYFVKEL